MAGISLFEVIGPNMVGPSSSHTAGAVSMALLASKLLKEPVKQVAFTLYGSFAQTYRGHGTDRALLGGMMGFETDDLRIRDAFSIAEKRNIAYSFQTAENKELHPNTADMDIVGESGKKLFVRGISIGGGKVKIVRLNQIDVDFTGEYSTLIVSQVDKQGIVAHITKCLNDYNVNIAFMRLFREDKGAAAFTIVETDDKILPEIVEEIEKNEHVSNVMLIEV